MNTHGKTVFGAGFMLATLMAAFAAYSQETDELRARGRYVSDSCRASSRNRTTTNEELDDRNPVCRRRLLAGRDRTETNGGVMDRMDLGRTEITGNQELPKGAVHRALAKSESRAT